MKELDAREIRVGIIGGTRGMGRWFADFLAQRGHPVEVCGQRTAVTPAMLAASCEVVVVSVPIGITVKTIEAIGPLVPEGSLLMDLTSLKAAPVKAMLENSCAEVIGCHPLFGPRVRNLRGRSVVLCPARTSRWLPWLRGIHETAGALIVETTPEAHDQRMAVVQALNHLNSLLMGLVAGSAGADLEDLRPYSTPAFDEKMKLVYKVFYPHPQLSAEIIALNPDIRSILDLYEQMLAKVRPLILNNDLDGMSALMNDHRARLWPAG